MPATDFVETGSGPTAAFHPGILQHARGVAAGPEMAFSSLSDRRHQPLRLWGNRETRTREDFGMQHELRIIEHVARSIGGPVHLVGHSFGGTVALAAALANSIDVASLAIFEANPLALIRDRPRETHYQDVLTLSHEFKDAVDAGKADAASIIIDFWGGRGTFAVHARGRPELLQADSSNERSRLAKPTSASRLRRRTTLPWTFLSSSSEAGSPIRPWSQ